jgi:replication factor A1
MIKLPFEDIVAKIKEKSSLSEDEIKARVDEKLKQLSGLVSKEGAAHIVANELGVKLFEAVSGKLQIGNILAGMRDVETVGKVQQIFGLNEFQRKDGTPGKVASFVIGDETGAIRIVGWGSQADNVAKLQSGDIAKIVGGYVRENQGRKEVHLNDRSKLIQNPPGVTVGEVKQATEQKAEAVRKSISELKENEQNIEVLGTIVQVFDLRFFEMCPKCNKRARMRDGAFFCEKDGQVEPDYSYVTNLVLDDGTENIRVVFFRNQLEKLLGMTKEQVLQYKSSPEGFEQIKSDLLGNQIKVVGRTTKNEMFNRVEFMAQLVFPNPSPKEEVERLKEATEPMADTQEEKSVIEEIEKIN